MPRSVDRFQAQIKMFQQVRTQGEKAGRISQREMKDALTEIAPGSSGEVSKAELKAAQDLFNSDTGMTQGGRELLKSFIEQYSTGPAQQHGTGLRQLETADEVRTMLRDPGTLDSVFSQAFGNIAFSRSHSKEVGDINKLPNGNFEVELSLVHWRHRGVMKATTAELNPAGVLVGGAAPDPVDPRDAKITADGPIGGGGRIFKVRADDPIPPQPAPGGPGDVVKVRADDPISGGPDDVIKVRADDPIDAGDLTDTQPDPIPPQPPPFRPGSGRVFKITADDPT
jgi:hypothetical protein